MFQIIYHTSAPSTVVRHIKYMHSMLQWITKSINKEICLNYRNKHFIFFLCLYSFHKFKITLTEQCKPNVAKIVITFLLRVTDYNDKEVVIYFQRPGVTFKTSCDFFHYIWQMYWMSDLDEICDVTTMTKSVLYLTMQFVSSGSLQPKIKDSICYLIM